MIKVMVFGTFDVLHRGHKYFLEEAKKRGDCLVVVVARDLTVKQLKKVVPVRDERKRMADLKALGVADKIVLGSLSDKYRVIKQEKPDIICLGYDQSFFTEALEEELDKRKLKAGIARIGPFKKSIYKSSIIKRGLGKN
jgi:FAD synthetase